MELSQKLKQARLDAGLSQKALCGDRITRNMLSQIENGSARPSMDTLKFLAGQLGKPLSYFLEEDAVTSPNLELMAKARSAEPAETLRLLEQYQSPDPTFDQERWFLEALTCLTLAEDALLQNKSAYARNLLERAQLAGSHTPYYTADHERRRLLLLHRAGEAVPENQLPSLDEELLLRAQASLTRGNFDRCAAFLAACSEHSLRWHYISGKLHLAKKEFSLARPCLEDAWELDPKACCSLLEDCCRESGDFAGAYFYACKLRELNRF